MVKTEIMTVARTEKGTAVLLKSIIQEKAVPIFIGSLEAQAILIGLGKVPMPRPLTHDLMVNLLLKAKITVTQLEIKDLQDDTYYAQLVCKQGVKKIVLDCRPSDGLALASRLDIPIFMNQRIIDEVGIPLSLIREDGVDTNIKTEQESLEVNFQPSAEEERLFKSLALHHQLEKALEDEDYESAASIRDEIKLLGDSDFS